MPKKSITLTSSIALTERCVDIREFMSLLQRGATGELVEHLKKCRTCRKVAADAVKALYSEGMPFEVPAPLKKLAVNIVGAGEAAKGEAVEEEIPLSITIRESSIEVMGSDYEKIGKTPAVKLAPKSAPYDVRITVELVGEVFLIRVTSTNAAGAVATLKDRRDSLCAPARRLDAGLSWAGLAASDYRLKISGKEGSVTFKLLLNRGPRKAGQH